jgi:hypothetical protein
VLKVEMFVKGLTCRLQFFSFSFILLVLDNKEELLAWLLCLFPMYLMLHLLNENKQMDSVLVHGI